VAGRGPAPKNPSKRARTNKDVAEIRVLTVVPDEQPKLPTRYVTRKTEDGTERVRAAWPVATRRWWDMWGNSPLANDFTETDWAELLIAAFLHAEFMEGDYKLAGELRLRTAKFGATPEDRLRLRIQFAQAVDAEVTTARKVQTSRDRFRGITVSDEMQA
tara:strand:- start:19890 stop:20369 length:480 start_codon:yes stop_codon:yes gene_type:complete